MHTALLNQDIFLEILGHLWTQYDLQFPEEGGITDERRFAQYDRKITRSTLLNLALTCHAFTEGALDELWRKIDKMLYLLRLLSGLRLVRKHNQLRYILDRPILDSELALLDKYARRVRTLIYYPEGNIDPWVYFRVAQGMKKPFFPLLRDLCITGYGPEVALLVSPSLLRVHAMPYLERCGHENPPVMWSFFDSILEQAPDMQYLHFGFSIPERSLDCISKLENLRHVGISQDSVGRLKTPTRLDSTFLETLAHMRCLSSMYFCGLVDFSLENSFVDFCSLTKLTITSTVQQVVPLLQSGKWFGLESFTLAFAEGYKSLQELTADFEEASWHAFFLALRQNTGQQFKELNLGYDATCCRDGSGRYGIGRYPDTFRLVSDIRAPIYADLLKLNLTKVNIAYAAFWSLSPAHMRGFIKAWPDIEELHIFTPRVGTLDFHALIQVAENLPHLESLLFSFRTENVPELNAVPSLSHRLVSLNVWASPLVKPMHLSVARGLFKLFPTICDFEYDPDGPYAPTWRRAGAIIPFLQDSARRNQKTLIST
ncbi:hypothetical protein BDZ97DRAFT_1760466 [Flammula alnicola]|nr:hypothetical protein BDZ97DRAFT_1760466 [Flammula alnicola]